MVKRGNEEYMEAIKKIWKILSAIFWGIVGGMTSILKAIIGVIVIGVIVAGLVGLILFIKLKPELDECMQTSYDKLSSMDEADFYKPMDTYIYDKDGNTIGIISAGHFEYVEINEISLNLQNAYISQEDKRFKEHCGVDLISTARAGLALIKNKGEITQGGSTITQQVIKNTYLTQEQSFKRKLIEMMMAPRLEAKFSKPKIMEFYCNTNFYGNRCYGVQAASQFYFGKDAKNLSIAEACLLAGISNSPSTYDPIKKPDAALEKRNQIISNMCDNGFITQEQKKTATNEKMEIVEKEFDSTFETYQSSYAVHCAAIALMKEDGFKFQYTFADKEIYDDYIKRYSDLYQEKTDLIRSGGFNIYTSLDSSIQEIAQSKLDSVLEKFTETQENGKYALQGAAAIADNTSGYIVAIIGGRGKDDPYNRAYLSARQPGSVIKPLIDYAPAFETGRFYPSKIMDDHEIEGGPKNSGGGYRGQITIREALNRSINTIAWQVLQEIGVNHGLDYLGRMHFHKLTYVDNDVEALSIGGFTNGVRIVDIAKGYQTLANEGIYKDNTCILDIKNEKGESVLQNRIINNEKIFTEDTAFMITDILKGTMTEPYGTGHGLALKNMPAAGKTGTTNSNKDTWYAGYTKYYTTAVWVGYDQPREMPGVYGATYAGKIWNLIMEDIHTELNPQDWIQPDTVTLENYNPSDGAKSDTETGLQDYFSQTAETALQRYYEEEENKARIDLIENDILEYEKKLIHGPEDTYTIEDDFINMTNRLSEIEDSSKRKDFYDRIYAKYNELIEIKNSMAEEIALYEKQKAAAEREAELQAQRDAEQARLDSIKTIRNKAFTDAVSKLENMEYLQEDVESLVTEAKEKLDMLKEYDIYTSAGDRLKKAVDNLSNLKLYDEYIHEKEQIEESKALEESKKQQEKETMEEEVNTTIINEIHQIDGEYGPGMKSVPPVKSPQTIIH